MAYAQMHCEELLTYTQLILVPPGKPDFYQKSRKIPH